MIATGTVIDDRYEVVSTLGIGGFGAVYRAKQVQFEREVAIKILTTSLLEEPDGVARFEREAKAINALKHKNIVGLYAYGVWGQAPYMVMELVLGTSLEKALRTQSQIDPPRALRLIKQVFEGLACAHAAGVVHRDLKPSNVMITTDADDKECVKLIDFGLAKLMPTYGEAAQKLTETGFAVGTCDYMAPEQALGGAIDQRTDIYATGCILYQMLSGHVAFMGADPMEVMHQHLNDAPPPFGDALPPGVPADTLYSLVLNCMAKDPRDRYQSCAEAITDIDYLLQGKYSKLRTTGRNSASSATVQNKRVTRSHKLAWAVGAALLIGLVTTSVVIDANIRDQHRLAQIENDKALVQEEIRLRNERNDDPKSAAKAQFARIKQDDDKYHFLSTVQRQFVLNIVGLQEVSKPAGQQVARALADEALALLPQAVADGSRTATEVADIYAKLGDEKKALEALDICVRSRDVSTRFQARRRLIYHFLAKRDYQKAEALARENLNERSQFTSTAMTMLDIGRIAFVSGNYAKSLEYYEDIARQKDEPEAFLGAARNYFALGKCEECIEWCNMGIAAYRRIAARGAVYRDAEELRAKAESACARK